jgi:3-hydroxybutyryl-CoA dehydrogenase
LRRYWGEDRYTPAPLLRQKVFAGHLGKKSGQGFYKYDVR